MAQVKIDKKGTAKNVPTKYKMLDVISKEYQKEISKHAQRLFDAANKRLKRIEQAKMTSPAYISAMKTGGKFSGRGLKNPDNWNLLIHEYARVVNFLNMETSTLGGARKYENKMEELFGNLDGEKREIIWDAVSMVEELGAVSAQMYDSDRLIKRVTEMVDNDVYEEIEKYERGSREYIESLSRIVEQIKKEVDEFYGDTVYKNDAEIDYYIHFSFDDKS